MKEVPLSAAKADPSALLREAEKQDIIITRHGKPAGILIGFKSEEEWFEYRLQHDERFLRRIESARKSLRAGRGTRLEGVKSERRHDVLASPGGVGGWNSWPLVRRPLCSGRDDSWSESECRRST